MDEKQEASYYGILPANVRYDKRLKPMEKIMYTEITCLSNKYGYCYSRNKYFTDLYGVSKETVSRWISNLVNLGYVNSVITYKKCSNEVDERFLTINPIPIDLDIKGGIDLNVNTGHDKKIIRPIDEKIKDNTTSNSNIINNNIEDHFDLVWKLYPLKKGKGKISLTKKKVMKNYTLDQWQIIIKRYDSSVLDKTFLMHGSTFFNGGYVDYTDANYVEQNFKSEKKKETNTLRYRPDFSEITEEDEKGGAEFFGKFKGGNIGK